LNDYIIIIHTFVNKRVHRDRRSGRRGISRERERNGCIIKMEETGPENGVCVCVYVSELNPVLRK
jgi:hypothetical protein